MKEKLPIVTHCAIAKVKPKVAGYRLDLSEKVQENQVGGGLGAMACSHEFRGPVDPTMSISLDDFDVPDDAMRVKVVSELDVHHVLGSRHVEEQQAQARLSTIVSPRIYRVLMASLDPKNATMVQISGGEPAQLYTTLSTIRRADREAGLLEESREVARRNSLLAHVALVDPGTLQGVRARIIRDDRLTPSSLILLPRNTASPEDVAAGIAAMSRLRRLYGDAVLARVEIDVLELRATLSTAQTGRARQILNAAMTGPTQFLPAIGDASVSSIRLSPIQP
ncbi:MAG TPA: hypothetical protein VGJ18_19615 [Gemmatimonadaceae bacterium]|jgi:hypothetical protein